MWNINSGIYAAGEKQLGKLKFVEFLSALTTAILSYQWPAVDSITPEFFLLFAFNADKC